MSSRKRLLDLFSSKTDNETRNDPHRKVYEIRSLLGQEDIIDPAYIEGVKKIKPQPDDLFPLFTVSLLPYVNDKNFAMPAWDLLMWMTKAGMEIKFPMFNPQTKLPYSTYRENGTFHLIFENPSGRHDDESQIGNWLVRFADAVTWFKANNLPFAAQWDAELNVAPPSRTRSSADRKEEPALPLIPGVMPGTENGKLAVQAAWELECNLKRKSTSKEVMSLLIEWARIGEKPGILKEPGKDGRSVEWITDKSKQKNYSLEALGVTLKKWHESRAKPKLGRN